MPYGSVRPIDRTLSSATTPGKSRPGSNGNEESLNKVSPAQQYQVKIELTVLAKWAYGQLAQ